MPSFLARAPVVLPPLLLLLLAAAPKAALATRHIAESAAPADVAAANLRLERDFANADILDRLFGTTGLDDDEEGGRPPVHYDEEDDAFLGVVEKLMEVIGSSEDGTVSRDQLSAAARHDGFPHFARFVEELADEADSDGDGRLDEDDAQAFLEAVRLHVAREVYGREDGEEEAALLRIAGVLEAHAGGGVARRTLVEAASTHFYPELPELVGELFDDVDADRDGVLSKAELQAFKSLFSEALHFAAADDGDSDSEESDPGDHGGEAYGQGGDESSGRGAPRGEHHPTAIYTTRSVAVQSAE